MDPREPRRWSLVGAVGALVRALVVVLLLAGVAWPSERGCLEVLGSPGYECVNPPQRAGVLRCANAREQRGVQLRVVVATIMREPAPYSMWCHVHGPVPPLVVDFADAHY